MQTNIHPIFVRRSARVFELVLLQEQRIKLPADFMDKRGIPPLARRMTVDWMIDCCSKLKLFRNTLFLAVSILDRYLATVGPNIVGSSIQFAGMACLLIAAKFDEPSEDTWVSDFSGMLGLDMHSDLTETERKILKALKFDIWFPTPKLFLDRYEMMNNVSPFSTDWGMLTMYLMEMCLYEEVFSPIVPSLLTAACIYVSRFTLSLPAWTDQIRECTGHSEAETKKVAIDVNNFMRLSNSRSKNAVNRYYDACFPVVNAKFGDIAPPI